MHKVSRERKKGNKNLPNTSMEKNACSKELCTCFLVYIFCLYFCSPRIDLHTNSFLLVIISAWKNSEASEKKTKKKKLRKITHKLKWTCLKCMRTFVQCYVSFLFISFMCSYFIEYARRWCVAIIYNYVLTIRKL